MSTAVLDPSATPPLYADRTEWADVAPQDQYENVNPLAPIFYSPECQSRGSQF